MTNITRLHATESLIREDDRFHVTADTDFNSAPCLRALATGDYVGSVESVRSGRHLVIVSKTIEHEYDDETAVHSTHATPEAALDALWDYRLTLA
jgi:hypothetical protein